MSRRLFTTFNKDKVLQYCKKNQTLYKNLKDKQHYNDFITDKTLIELEKLHNLSKDWKKEYAKQNNIDIETLPEPEFAFLNQIIESFWIKKN